VFEYRADTPAFQLREDQPPDPSSSSRIMKGLHLKYKLDMADETLAIDWLAIWPQLTLAEPRSCVEKVSMDHEEFSVIAGSELNDPSIGDCSLC